MKGLRVGISITNRFPRNEATAAALSSRLYISTPGGFSFLPANPTKRASWNELEQSGPLRARSRTSERAATFPR